MGEHVIGTDPDCKRGSNICNPKVIRRKINVTTDVTIHEQYVHTISPTNLIHDIALIRMEDPVPLYQEDSILSAANPICLPWSEESYAHYIQDNNNAMVAGWGATNFSPKFSGWKFAKHLLQLKVPIANDRCKSDLFDAKRQICAGGETGWFLEMMNIY